MDHHKYWHRLPAELRAAQQWVIAGECAACLAILADKSDKRDSCGQEGCRHKAPLYLVGDQLRLANVKDPSTWMLFEQAASAAYRNGLHVGFVLTGVDPWCCIDLDVKDPSNCKDASKWTTQQQFDRFWSITQAFDSYTETSRSGKGLHVWVRGAIGLGVKRDGVEVYSQERYIISTGRVVADKPICDRQTMLDNMVPQMRSAVVRGKLTELEETHSDSEIYERASNAGNSEKFNELCAGRWEQYGFPSQSEADLALMSIFTFYSQSNEQCRRLFRCTALGKRAKATKDDRYLDFTLKIIRGRQSRENAAVASGEVLAAQLIASLNARAQAAPVQQLHVPSDVEVRIPIAPAVVTAALAGPVSQAFMDADDNGDGIKWPPGLAGTIAGYIYQSAPRPVKEVAIVAALGMLAGICGKAYNIPQSGLNLYIILVARSAVGKEAMHSGVSQLINAVSMRCPTILKMVDFTDFVSGPALVKACAKNNSFVNVAGEWGRKLRKMATDEGRDGPMSSLRTVMTNLYQKSGSKSMVGGLAYSDKDKNVQTVTGVAFSLIGESTPNTFYETLTPSMLEDGFLSRFTVVEYDGPRPPLNACPVGTPCASLADALATLTTHAGQIAQGPQTIMVQRDNASAEIMRDFELECDREINSTTDESWRQMWNRASLKVMRISALLAAGDNSYFPVIQVEHVNWALDLVRRDMAIMRKRLESGDVGQDDLSRERKLLSVITGYLTKPLAEGYKVPSALKDAGIVPRKFLQVRCQRSTAFTQHRLGANGALDASLRSMVDSGYLMLCDKNKMSEQFGFFGTAYRVLELPDYVGQRKTEK